MTIRKFSVCVALLLAHRAGAQYTPLGSPSPTPTPSVQQPARTVMVNSNSGLLLYPTNFWSANASEARAGLSLGSSATNAASAFQASSAVLSNLASSNAVNLTNIRATNIVGVIPSSNIATTTLTNISGTLSILSGGTGATNAAGARTNLGLGSTWLTNTTASNFLSAIGLGASNNVQFAEVIALSLGVGLGTNSYFLANSEFVETALPIQFASDSAAGTRTNLGLGWSALTNTNAATTLLGRTADGQVVSGGVNTLRFVDTVTFESDVFAYAFEAVSGSNFTQVTSDGIDFSGEVQRSNTRANLGFSTALNSLWTATNAESARDALGAGTGSGQTGSVDLASTNATGVLPISKGGTSATNAIGIRQAIGLQSYTTTLTNSVNNVEIGSAVSNVILGWTIAPTEASYAVRSLVGANQTNTITNNIATLARSNLTLTSNTIWTLTVGDGFGVTNTVTTSVAFLNYMIWGRSTNTTLSNSNLQTLHDTGGNSGRAFSTTRSRSFTMDGGARYLYIAYPLSFGNAVAGGVTNAMIVDGNVFNNFVVTTNVYTNAQGFTNAYLIYRTVNIINGSGVAFTVQ